MTSLMLTAAEWQKGLLWLGLGICLTTLTAVAAMLLRRDATWWTVLIPGGLACAAILWLAVKGLPDWLLARHYLTFVLPAIGLLSWMFLFLWAYFSLCRQCGVLRGALAQVMKQLGTTEKIATDGVSRAKDAWELASDAKGKPRFTKNSSGHIVPIVPKFPNVESINEAMEDLRDELRSHGVPIDEWDKVAGREE